MNGERGLLLSFEGIDASGKNTQSKKLSAWLRSSGIQAEYLSFPDYNTKIGMEISAFLSGKKKYNSETKHMLFAANRYEHKEQIERWLGDSKVVVMNRYCDSNIAFGVANGLPVAWLEALESRMPQSDYIFFLDATLEVSKARKPNRDLFEKDYEFLLRVSSVYSALSERKNWFRINANNTVESVHYEVKSFVEAILNETRGINKVENVGAGRPDP